MEETEPERTKGQTGDRLYWVWEEKAIEHLPWKPRCASGRILPAFYGDIFKYIKEKSFHMQLQKSSILPNLKADARIVDTAYSSQRRYPEVERQWWNIMKIEWQRWNTDHSLLKSDWCSVRIHLPPKYVCAVWNNNVSSTWACNVGSVEHTSSGAD